MILWVSSLCLGFSGDFKRVSSGFLVFFFFSPKVFVAFCGGFGAILGHTKGSFYLLNVISSIKFWPESPSRGGTDFN